MRVKLSRKHLQGAAVLLVISVLATAIVWSQTHPPSEPTAGNSLQPGILAPQGSAASAGSQPDVPVQVQKSVTTGFAVQHDISPVLRDIPIPQETPPAAASEMPDPGGDESGLLPGLTRLQIADPVLQDAFSRRMAQVNATVAGVNFEGISNLDGVYPPDTNGDVGPNHYVQMVNVHFAVYSKAGGAPLYGPAANNTLFTGFGGPCETRNDGDPIVLYDKIADRWVLSQFLGASPYGECIAVSTGPNPTGSYYRYFFQFSAAIFYDYPKLGLWPDGYYLTANRFSGSVFQGASAIALNRTAMLSGAPANFQEFQTSASYGVLLPSSLDGPTQPPAGSPNYLLEVGASALHLWKFHVDWITSANSALTGPTSIPIAAFNQLCAGARSCIPQPGTGVKVDGLGDRLMQRLAYRNLGAYESLVVSHNVNAAATGSQAGLRWYEIRSPNGAVTLFQQGTFAPDAANRWAGSAAMDKLGNIALGYSISSSTVFPGIRYTGRLVTDPAGLMTEPETTLIAGAGVQTGPASRWGDYANMAVDPSDDCTFWFTTEYITTTSTVPWQTRIGSFRFANCGATLPPTPIPTATPAAVGGRKVYLPFIDQ